MGLHQSQAVRVTLSITRKYKLTLRYTRVSRSLLRHGLESRGNRKRHCSVLDRHKMGTMASCGKGFPASCGLERSPKGSV